MCQLIRYFSIFLISMVCLPAGGTSYSKDSLGRELDLAMKNKQMFSTLKQEKILELKRLLNIGKLSLDQEYDLNMRLFREYVKYATDSAVVYIRRNVSIAKKMGDDSLYVESQVLLASVYSTRGLYIESKQILDKISAMPLDAEQRALLFETYSVFYSHYGQSNGNYEYYQKSSDYRDSLLAIIPPSSMTYRIENLVKQIYATPLGNDVAEQEAHSLLNDLDDSIPERAKVAFLLSEFHKQRKNYDQQEIFLMVSAIADIKNSIRDNASLASMAMLYYEQENIKQAYHFMQEAMNDAVFCNVRYRASEASSSYPIINTLFNQNQKRLQSQLMAYLVMISILSFILIVAIVFVFFQLRRVARIRRELSLSNEELNRLNSDLKKINEELNEANLIKEEYITHFFDRCSNYIDKLGEYKKSLAKHASTSQLEELFKMIKSNTIIEEEVEELYKTFDTIFLNLYPSFIDEFNSLLVPGEKIVPKHGEMLNTELRIYALIRLGITDSVKIASFLRYSLRTVYNYRTKIRNKAAGKRDDFETLVARIGAGIVRKP